MKPSHSLVRLAFPLICAAGLLAACNKTEEKPAQSKSNPSQTVDGPKRNANLPVTRKEEVTMGQQNIPFLIHQFGGLSTNKEWKDTVKLVGKRLLAAVTDKPPEYQFDFYLLADEEVPNAFALPGGQICITTAMYLRLATHGELASVLGHEIGHVMSRHGAERMTQEKKLAAALEGAKLGSKESAALASQTALFSSLKYSRDMEHESDLLGARYMYAAGYDPRAAIKVMEILKQLEAEMKAKGDRQADFMASHPGGQQRVDRMKQMLQTEFPQGFPATLEP